MNFRVLLRHFRESWKNLFRNGWMSFASISAVSITLLILGMFTVLSLNLNHVAKNMENNVEIRVHLDQTIDELQRTEVETKLKQLPNVKSVTFSSKDQELTNVSKSFGGDGSALRMLEQDNPLRDVYVVKLDDPHKIKATAEKIDKFENVSIVKYGQGFVSNLFKVTEVGRNVGIGLIAALLFTTLFLISNTIKMTIIARRKEIEIMRLVGARNGFIRWPFFLEGIWLGVLGSVVPIVALTVGYNYLSGWASGKMTLQYISLLPFNPFVWQLAAILIGIGSVIGVLASMQSIRKYMKV